ncbi:sensor histidine kinase [Cyclobacterium marinum]|uniref:histidine kinase n=1 Tax=Cyclobacterium marinum (strain ATCC 25205 / DSM 745 / LMG 13164 / NCIMB 1802) TaxID=880070 RepID=G0J3Q7_CYCMS|nr:HAMP domain-containing sensor histidine kinase [Cyclobacterium marinum]AEL25263.1 integral membrane sensor signal transduction histidine kinase [Cyclobacterium marinum DSM 745]MBI0400668.1 HAMP domain-containing histidine kinase [Cyclobacterium marinum]MBR9776580.1 HAMP domain-containing histidine kinase [Cytophagales bacterium]|tara:strand:+ start:10778 stop:12148 length:1371 start_codon:yes stop_codon:yes gene_type:complete
MKIRNKILIYFSTTVIALTAISLMIIYILFSEYREEEFQQQQNEKIHTTIKLIEKIKQESATISYLIDQQDINDFYDEKLLVYDSGKNLIFASLDSLDIVKAESILNKLSQTQRWIETKEENYDLIGIYAEANNQTYYAVSKAYDAFGYTKMYFLRNVLIGIFLFITFVVILISRFLSNKISKPITALADKLKQYDLSKEKVEELPIETTSYELKQLTLSFNELIKRTNEAFVFQKHTIHHISHQLKTPISVLVSELERIKNLSNTKIIKSDIENQINKTKSLGSIINVLLEISKIEAGQQTKKQFLRIDELFYDVMEELNGIYFDFHFEVNYLPDEFNEKRLVINLNPILIRQAIQNLLINCVSYSNNSKAEIKFDCTQLNELKIQILNSGKPISKREEMFLFNHFFRGQNSEGKIGFGLGLVLTKKIVELNSATITYSNPIPNTNVFELKFPLS